ncbi:MAG: hypothetical protein ABI549_10180, partial [Flavobacterium sp.]|uniref:hypothetical protein n=1 Tax=Flavobacterium sp. TaxID=239 RepID=UPI0032671EC3
MCPSNSQITLNPNYSIQNLNFSNEITPWLQTVLGSNLAPNTTIGISNSSYVSRNPYQSNTVNDFFEVYGLNIKFNSFNVFNTLALSTELWDPSSFGVISTSSYNDAAKKITSFSTTNNFVVKVNNILLGTYDLINHPDVCEAAVENLYPGSNCTINFTYDEDFHYLNENINTNVSIGIHITNSPALIQTITINNIEIGNTNPDCYSKQSNSLKNFKTNAKLTYNPTSCTATPSDLCLLYGTTLNLNNPIVYTTITQDSSPCGNGNTLYVKKGERIYFRVHSITNGNAPINWNPQIQYVASNLNTVTDANGLTPFSSSYLDSFVLTGKTPIQFPGSSGTANISWDDFSVTPTDHVTYRIIKKTIKADQESGSSNPNNNLITTEQIIYSQLCPANISTVISPTSNLNSIVVTDESIAGLTNLSQTFFYFEVVSTSNSNWKVMEWKPKMICSTIDQVIGENGPEGSVTTNQTVYPIADYDIYKLYPCGPIYNKLDISNLGNGLLILPNLNGVFSATDSGKINFVVKRGNQLLGKRIFTITNGVVTVDYSNGISLNNDPNITTSNELEISFTSDDSEYSDNQSILSKIALNSSTHAIITAGTTNYNVGNAMINLFQKANTNYGAFYRQWGQFMYNPKAVANALPSGIAAVNLIKEESLVVD